jgi:hypothetical protein
MYKPKQDKGWELFKLLGAFFILAIVIALFLGWYHSTLIWM